MAYRTANGIIYLSSFAGIIATICGTDLEDPVDVACTVDFVEAALEGRVKEELEGTGDLTREYAHLRLRGAVRTLEKTQRQVGRRQAPHSLIYWVAETLREARKALAIAEAYHDQKQSKGRAPQDWTKDPDPGDDDSPLYAPVTTAELFDAVSDVKTGTTVEAGE